MKIEIDTGESGDPDPRIAPRPRRRLPDYQSTGFRLRLMSLFAALVLVLILMKEAGKPERWLWMGFEPTVPAESEADGTPAKQNENLPTSETPERSAPGNTSASPPIQLDAKAAAFGSLETADLVSLLFLFRTIESGKSIPQSKMARVKAAWVQFREKLPTGEREDQSVDLVLSTVDKSLSGDDYTVGGQQAVLKLQPFLDAAVMQRVEDATAVGHPNDAPAWIRLWNRVSSVSFPEWSQSGASVDNNLATRVTRVQLMSQPAVWRGRVVEIEGWVRSARYVDRPVKSLGIAGYFELWIRPADTNTGPCCLYVLNLPNGFPDIGEDFVKLNERFQANACFFKNRNYVAADSTVQVCPLLLGRAVSWSPATTESRTEAAWRPDAATFTSIVAGLMILAGLIAWAVRQSNKSQPFQPGEQTRRVIGQSLAKLQDDPGVQTDTEKIRQLGQRLNEIEAGHDL